MKEIINRIIREILGKKGIAIEKVILFGSRTTGDFREDSDWDFLVIIDKKLSFNEKWDIIDEIKRKLAENSIPNDIIIKSSQEIEDEKDDVGKITFYAMKEGTAL